MTRTGPVACLYMKGARVLPSKLVLAVACPEQGSSKTGGAEEDGVAPSERGVSMACVCLKRVESKHTLPSVSKSLLLEPER